MNDYDPDDDELEADDELAPETDADEAESNVGGIKPDEKDEPDE